ncbi:MAG: sugar ABC transporter ATP-binding protein [Homoserinimonas sp.]
MVLQADVPRLEFRDLTVDFGATRALDGISVSFQPGEIVGLLGHNGAGKTTLFNVAAAVISASGGSYLMDGTEIPGHTNPAMIAGMGMTIIHQEPALAPNLSVFDNLFLARKVSGSRKDRVALATDALERVGATVSLDQPVETLSLGDRQLVDLARGLLGGELKVLLLDEPTAALGLAETKALHDLIRAFAAAGTLVIYVSHRLPDILEVCERIVVLRAGRLVVDDAASAFTPRKLAEALVPDVMADAFEHPQVGDEVLSVAAPAPIAFREGEVVGLFGMAGGEQFTLLERMFGLHDPFRFTLDGRELTISSPNAAIRHGVLLCPADREKDGLIGGLPAAVNVFLPWYGERDSRGWWVDNNTGKADYELARRELNILGPDGTEPIDQFSGGNRQKHLLARWMIPRVPRVLLLAQPTQGVDVGAKVDIARMVRKLARTGTVVIIASAESDEISSMCDRAYVMLGDRAQLVERGPDFDESLLSTLLQLAAHSTAA